MSLRSKVFEWLDHNNAVVTEVYKEFPDAVKTTVKRYFYDHRNMNASVITGDILTIKIDTIKEMELCVHQIKDPVKRSEAISRLHTMKLKPLKNTEEKSLKEMFDNPNT